MVIGATLFFEQVFQKLLAMLELFRIRMNGAHVAREVTLKLVVLFGVVLQVGIGKRPCIPCLVKGMVEHCVFGDGSIEPAEEVIGHRILLYSYTKIPKSYFPKRFSRNHSMA